MAYLLSNNCTKNYWNLTATVKIIVGARLVYFLQLSILRTQCHDGDDDYADS